MQMRQGRALAVDDRNDVAELLTYAHGLGQSYAARMVPAKPQEGLGDFAKSVLDKARDLIDSAISWARDLFSSKVGALGDDPSDADIEAALEDTASTVAGGSAPTAIQDMIEQTVLSELQTAGVARIVWVVEPDACEVCTNNAEYGPIAIGEAFPSGHERAPAHLRCKCHVAPAEEG
jgi:hypothetical protein